MDVKIQLNGGIMPQKQHVGDAAFDLYVPENVPVVFGRKLIDMKFALELPDGYAAIIQPRSGCSLKGIEVFNDAGDSYYMDADVKIGLVDSNDRKNVGTIIQMRYNPAVSQGKWYIKKGSRISQMRIVEVPSVDLVLAEMLSVTDREGGFGTTGQR